MNGFKKPVLDLVGRTCCNHSLLDALTKAKNSREYQGCLFTLSKRDRDTDKFLIKKVQEMGHLETFPDVDIVKVSFHQ